MKNVYLRSMLAAACAATLAACGGSGGNLYLGGNVIGLAKSGLVLKNGDSELEVLSGATTFYFPNLVKADDRYDIKILTQPKGATCTITGGTGKANSYSASNAVVSCITDQYTLGGSISGLTADGLILANGQSQISPLANSTKFVFASTVGDGATYTVNVFKNPPGLACTISNPVGTMGSKNNDTLIVACVPA
ncbi:hypothetical protein [Janthinobacterium sp.]|uniref:hypothetical protein n=1 Tax=Janthinobacterium sp. TaxID=1871054 RepID=UPI0028A12105|nr:hypothetical protein [Janthinobacterium sp.]